MNDAHEQLLEKWANLPHHAGRGFIYDGIIDQEQWAKASRKVLFINKEAHDGNDPNPEGFDLRAIIRYFWQGQPKGKTYPIIATWAYAVHHAPIEPQTPFPRWDSIPNDKMDQSLLSSAVINIKKSNGTSVSNSDDLKGYVDSDGLLLREQINLIDPDIVICGYVWYLIKELWNNPKPEEIYDSVFAADGRIFIDFWHPANRSPEQMNYYALAALLQNSKAIERCKAGRSR